MRLSSACAVLFSLSLACGAAARAQALPEGLQVEGFATLGAYRVDDREAGFRADQRVPVAGTGGRWRGDGDSQFGLQMQAALGAETRLVWQLQAKDDPASRWRPRSEWLYLGWDFDASSSFKLGRVQAPVFLLSETRPVGFAQLNARPFDTIYQLNPTTHLDGASLSWTRELGTDDRLELSLAAGRSFLPLAIGSLDIRRIAALSLAWRRGDLLLRLGHSGYRGSLNYPSNEALLQQVMSGSTACLNCATVLAERAPFKQLDLKLSSLSMQWEPASGLRLQAELALRHGNTVHVPDVRGWYLLAGWRRGVLTPYAGLGELRFREPPLGLQTAPGAPAAAALFNSTLDLFLQAPHDRRALQAGLRWDLADKLALKLQWERQQHTRNHEIGSNGGSIRYPLAPPLGPGSHWDGRLQVLTVNLDLVF
ncbi:hypothetical protein [Pelomonas sp. SE-A7]|uniref:hypothetical protein n=1 Tax=Pelomonas sp. SE-A7 TaxID=3054953 RepID=UPI00259C8F6C|nr:hypothetical protein [Pelomonas sp. SE-A7]MDM4765681.1 hypothetical protein [Pelomonas sp. SE-A7]